MSKVNLGLTLQRPKTSEKRSRRHPMNISNNSLFHRISRNRERGIRIFIDYLKNWHFLIKITIKFLILISKSIFLIFFKGSERKNTQRKSLKDTINSYSSKRPQSSTYGDTGVKNGII